MSKILLNSGASERGFHRLQNFLICPQKYAYSTLLGIPINGFFLTRGSIIHTGMGHYYAQLRETQRGGDPTLYYDPHDAIDVAAAGAGEDGLASKDLAHTVLNKYVQTFERDTFRIVSVEEEIRAMLKDQWLFTARWDLVWLDSSDRYWIIDHKTAGKLRGQGPACYDTSGQVLMAQAMGAKLWGDQFGGVMLNFLGTTPPHAFARRTPEPAPNLVRSIIDDLCYAEEKIAELVASGRDLHNWPHAVNEHCCVTRYGDCEYRERCKWGRETSF